MKRLMMIALTASIFFTTSYVKGQAEGQVEVKQAEAQNQALDQAEEAGQAEIIAPEPQRDAIKFLQSQAQAYRLPDNRVDFANKNISEGLQVIKKIKANTQTDIEKLKGIGLEFTAMQKKYLSSIVALAWYLFAQAVKKGQGFTGGTIVFQDNGSRVYNFLLDYAKQFNRDVMQGNVDANYISFSNCYAYARHSTHFPELQNKPGYEQYGIDVRYTQDGDELVPDLPSNKQHILFGKIGNIAGTNFTFIKMELYGICGKNTDAVNHLVQLFKGKSGGVSRREDLPKVYKKRYKELLTGLTQKDKEILNEKVGKPLTIRGLYNALKSSVKEVTGKAVKLIKNFISDLETDFDKDTLSYRRGNEVILMNKDLK